MKLVLSCKPHFDVDVLFFSKSLLYASMKHHDAQSQILFNYQFDKLNLLNHYVPKYIEQLKAVPMDSMSLYKKDLPFDHTLMHFHTLSKCIDFKAPIFPPPFAKMVRIQRARVNAFVKHGNPAVLSDGRTIQFDDLSYQQAFDILEGYAYTKRGSSRSLVKLLSLIKSQFDEGKVQLTCLDEAILLTNALVEITHKAPKASEIFKQIRSLQVELLQNCINHIGLYKELQHTDQNLILLNALLSKHVLEGRIDLRSSPNAAGGGSSDSEASEEEESTPAIFNPELILDGLQTGRQAELQKVNRYTIINVIKKAMRQGDSEVKAKIVSIFRNSLLVGANFHYEVKNTHLSQAMREALIYFNTEQKKLLTDYEATALMMSLKQILDFKLRSNLLDLKTYLQILSAELQTCD